MTIWSLESGSEVVLSSLMVEHPILRGFPKLGIPFWGSQSYGLLYIRVYVGVPLGNYHFAG